MTHEETIKRIQKLVPSVMELEFGCVVEILIYHTMNSRSNGTYWRKHRVITIDCLSGDLILNRNGRYGNKKVPRSSQMQIIGKPITLAVVLMAMWKTGSSGNIELDRSALIPCVNFTATSGIKRWDLSKDNFNDQSEETKTFIGKLLVEENL